MVAMLLAGAARGQDAGISSTSVTEGAQPTEMDALKASFDARLNAANRQIQELREQMRTLLAQKPQQAAGWQAQWMSQKRKLDFVTFDGYFRIRPELFYNFNLWGTDSAGVPYTDPAGYSLWPASPVKNAEKTNAGVNMRFRVEPTINVSEEVRIRAQFDILDNVVMGSTPDYSYSLNSTNNYRNDRTQFGLFSTSQTPPRSGINSVNDAITLKRVWAEVSTPVGVLRFGRMPAQWGLGILYNDGSGIDGDFGDNLDRVTFTVEPVHGWFIIPMFEINSEGALSGRSQNGGQPFDLSNTDDVHAYMIAVVRKDTEAERRQKLEGNRVVLNYGLHFGYRHQPNESVAALSPFTADGQLPSAAGTAWAPRRASIFVTDLWFKAEHKKWRFEAEVASQLGTIGNRAVTALGGTDPNQNQSLYVYQIGGVIQGEYRFLNGDLQVGGELGVASGDRAPGFGVYARRGTGTNANYAPPRGAIDGPQYRCGAGGSCQDNEIWNFNFNPAYRVDMILYREILGGITDSIYLKPSIKYRITQGFEVWLHAIYSRAMFASSTPAAASYPVDANGNPVGLDSSLGIELNVGARYETTDGFFGQVQYGVLFPLQGFSRTPGDNPLDSTFVNLNIAHAVRGVVGVRF